MALIEIPADDGIVLTDEQEAAVDLITMAEFGCITGGPGVGKSLCTGEAARRLHAAGRPFKLCAPTGKAAKRLSDVSGYRATTIHRLLGITPGNMEPSADIDADVIIADEASMIDTELMAVLMSACVVNRCRLVLVGDADQLPSVGPGMVFRELLDVDCVQKVRLTEVHRSALTSWIGRNAPRIRVGEMPELTETDDFRFMRAQNASQVLKILTEFYSKLTSDKEEPLLLTPQNKGPLGTIALNNLIQSQYNPPRNGYAWEFTNEYMIDMNDPVLQTKNDYDLNVFNGEIGDVVDISKDHLIVSFGDDRFVTYKKRDAWNLKLAYALTVHKSQGSESNCVIFIAHPMHSFMLSRSLFYTAVTRSKNEVAIIGTEGAVAGALNKISDTRRNTLLSTRIGDAQKREVAA